MKKNENLRLFLIKIKELDKRVYEEPLSPKLNFVTERSQKYLLSQILFLLR